MTQPCFALIGCNNFYASCEKHHPDLKHTPVVLLSNNGSCVVARLKEVKRHRIVAFSSNYALYADISNRVMTTLEELAPKLEIYSIDEAFLDLTGVAGYCSLTEFGKQVHHKIYDWINNGFRLEFFHFYFVFQTITVSTEFVDMAVMQQVVQHRLCQSRVVCKCTCPLAKWQITY